jgi:hypothetical protein
MPSKRNRKIQRLYDEHTYKERYLIECFFGKIKHFRCIFSRFDKAASTFFAFLSFVGALIWLRSFRSQNLDDLRTYHRKCLDHTIQSVTKRYSECCVEVQALACLLAYDMVHTKPFFPILNQHVETHRAIRKKIRTCLESI